MVIYQEKINTQVIYIKENPEKIFLRVDENLILVNMINRRCKL